MHNGMNFQFRFAWNAGSSPALGPTDQRRSAGTTVSGSDDFLHLTQSHSATVECSRSSQLQRWDAVQKKTLFSSFAKGVTGILKDRTCLEKDTNECSCLICDSSCCRTGCVSVQPCTPKVLPNTEMFLPSRVFCLTCVVSALCSTCTMYVRKCTRCRMPVCSDGPPARTLSLT